MAKYDHIYIEKKMDEFSFTEKKNTMKCTELHTFPRQVESSSGRKEAPRHQAKRKGQWGRGAARWEGLVWNDPGKVHRDQTVQGVMHAGPTCQDLGLCSCVQWEGTEDFKWGETWSDLLRKEMCVREWRVKKRGGVPVSRADAAVDQESDYGSNSGS